MRAWASADVGPGAAVGQGLTQGVAVVGAIDQWRLAGADAVEPIGGAPAVMSLALGEFERDRIAASVDNGVYLGCRPTPRAPHASGCREVPRGGAGGFLRTPFLTFAAC